MVTQKAIPAAKPTTRPYRPHIRIVDASRGLYTVQSETYTHVLYGVDTINGTCECAAGRQGFRNCKRNGGVCRHLHICRAYADYRAAPSHLRPLTGRDLSLEDVRALGTDIFADLAAEFAALPTPRHDFSKYHGAEGLMECFS